MEMNLNLDGLDTTVESEIPAFAQLEGQEVDFAPSMEVQAAEIHDVFMDMPELQFENWQNLDADERVSALQELEVKVAEISHRPPVDVDFEQTAPNVMGYYNGEKIVISESLLMQNDKYEDVLDTLFHEGRHAYQDYNLYSGTVVEQNSVLVESWRDNYELGYESGNWSVFRDIGFLRYKTQPVEVDARAYANTVMGTLPI